MRQRPYKIFVNAWAFAEGAISMLRCSKAFRTVVGNTDQGVFSRPNLYAPKARERETMGVTTT